MRENNLADMIRHLHASLRKVLPVLEAQVNQIIENKITDRNRIDRLLNDLLDYAQIEEGLEVFKRLCRYTYPIYPDIAISQINDYRDMYDDTYTPPDSGNE
ncbi:MAG: hypothetical protein LBD02_08570 [Christensenellaceae bacterium]|jgi:signal transduction histidine kinase|nr:hypothetical protein [Christensenellaceae bacterium]